MVDLYLGDWEDFSFPSGEADLIVSSPPYNLGKQYEKKVALGEYLVWHKRVLAKCVDSLSSNGSLCWQTGNFVDRGSVVPLDLLLYPIMQELGLKMRNRIVWHFGHGLHCKKRFSGRYETIMWMTKSDDYYFDLDPIRVPQKYPNKKYYKGPKAGQLSCNPLGKNPGDVWEIPNVKYNHIEKTDHPCQFPVELVERLVLSMTRQGDLVLDPLMGSGSSLVAALLHGRRAAGCEIDKEYFKIAEERVGQTLRGEIKTRPMGRPVYVPTTKEGEK